MTDPQFDALAKKYQEADETHYVKRYSITPTLLMLLGNIKNKHILDIGCGYGYTSRILAEMGACILGIDSSQKMIDLANAEETKRKQGIDYYCLDAEKLPELRPTFDHAVSILMLNYIRSQKQMNEVFSRVYPHLLKNADFIGFQNHLVEQGFNGGRANSDRVYERIESLPESPNIPRFRFTRTVGEQQFSAEINDWPKSSYQEAAARAGFKKIEWYSCRNVVSTEGLLTLPLDYWRNYREHDIFQGFKVTK